ncbi:MAG: hypothetical protein FJ221_09460 [Lentisphaerae bacterium]|nr:hypothetical protein [Lentisphaerota bacterium]
MSIQAKRFLECHVEHRMAAHDTDAMIPQKRRPVLVPLPASQTPGAQRETSITKPLEPLRRQAQHRPQGEGMEDREISSENARPAKSDWS